MPKAVRYGFLAFSLIATLSAVLFLWTANQAQHAQTLPVIGTIANFSMTDEHGQNFSSQTLTGKVWVADFIFTHCQGQCPILSSQVMHLRQKFDDAKTVQFVSISVDPDHDTPAALLAYAQQFDADASQWHFLTAPLAQVQPLMIQSFKIGTDKDPSLHSTYLVLVDQQQRIRGYYDGLDQQAVGKLFKDLKALINSRS